MIHNVNYTTNGTKRGNIKTYIDVKRE